MIDQRQATMREDVASKWPLRLAAVLLLSWSIITGLSLLFSFWQSNKTAVLLAQEEARAAHDKDVVYRVWNASHGGVYAPVTESTQPSPYLAHIEERDIETDSGRQLTLINPAFMTRQVHELGLEKYGYRGHITSLDPIRPENAPDAWEKEALVSFEKGSNEAVTMAEFDDGEYLRYMKPIVTKQGCLKCHGHQGYEVGDIRGGISVSVPMAPYRALAAQRFTPALLGHLLFLAMGATAIVFGTGVLLKQERKRRVIHIRLQESKERFEQLAEQSRTFTWEVDASGLFTHVGHAVLSVLGYDPEELVGKMHFYDLHPEEGRDAFKAASLEVFAGKEPLNDLENQIETKAGEILWVATNGMALLNSDGTLRGYRGEDSDITERKRAEEILQEKLVLLERFNRLSQGRELRMLELKSEVNEMARKAGAAPPYKSSDQRRADSVASAASESSTPMECQE